jgi:hypothetical protein
MEPRGSLPCSQKPVTDPYITLRSKPFILRVGGFSSSPNTKAGGPLLVGCQYIHSYFPDLEAVVRPQLEEAPCRGLWQIPT